MFAIQALHVYLIYFHTFIKINSIISNSSELLSLLIIQKQKARLKVTLNETFSTFHKSIS